MPADDICIRVSVRNAGPDRAALHVLPTLWFRNRWSWEPGIARPEIREKAGRLVALQDELGRMTAGGTFTFFPLPEAGGVTVAPGRDGDLWFTESVANRVGRRTLSGTTSEYAIPHAYAQPLGIVVDPDGNTWFAESGSSRIGRITPLGVLREF